MGKNEIYKWMKRSLKNKVSITGKMLVIFLISGTLSQAGAKEGTALAGGIATPTAENSVAIGNEAKASFKEAFAIGTGAKSNSLGAYAFGYFAEIGTNSDFAYSMGWYSRIRNGAKHSYAIGHYAEVQDNAENAYAIGKTAIVKKGSTSSYAIGEIAETNSINAYAIGQQANVQENSDHAYAIGHLSKVDKNAQHSYTLGSHAKIGQGASSAYALGYESEALKRQSYAIGHKASTNAASSYALGDEAKVNEDSDYGYAIGHRAEVDRSSKYSYAIGYEAKVGPGVENVYAIGREAKAMAKNSLVFGSNTTVAKSAENTVALGSNISGATESNSVYLGNGSTHGTQYDTTMGKGSYANTTINGHMFKDYAGINAYGVVTVGKKDQERRIQNVAAGWINPKSTDAVNGSQLYSVAKTLVDKLDDVVKYDKYKNKELVTLEGANGTKITNLQAGTVSATSKDAVNGSQLHEVKQKVEQNTTNITKIEKDIKNVVKYDGDSHDTITLKAGGTTIKNVKDATQKDEAVNYGQLKKTEQNLTDKGLTFAANKGADKKVKLGEKVEIKGSETLAENSASDKNVMTSISGNKITVKIATRPEFDEVKAGTGANKVVIGENKIELGGKTYITNTGINANNQKIINVATPTENNDAANKKYVDDQIKNVSGSFSGTLKYEADNNEEKTLDLKTGKLKLKGDNKNVTTKTEADGTIRFGLKEILELNKLRIDGTNGHITGLTNTTWNSSSVVENRAASEGQLKQVEQKLDNKISNNTTNIQQNKTDITNIKNELENVVKYDKNTNKGKVTLEGKNGGTTIDNVKDGKIAAGSKEAVNGGQINDIKKDIQNNTTNIQQNKTDITNIKKELDNVVKYDKNSDKGKVTLEGKNGGTTIDNVKDGKIAAGSKEAVNGGQLHDVEQKIKDVNNAVNNKGITFKGNSGENTSKLGDTFNIKGGNSLQEADADDKNIRTSLKGNTLHMQFAKRPDFEKVTAGKGPDKVSIGDDGVQIGDKTYVSKDGLNANGKKITNVKDGTEDSDAVNYGQLKKMMQNNGNVDEKIKTLDSKLSGAVAQAMAMANIPQVGDNKLFSIGVGGAYYNKQGGFAVGISGTEPSNTFIYKISAGVDTKKQWSIGAGFNLNFGTNKKANINNECCDLSNEKVKRLENENKNMKEQINDLKDLVKQLMNKIDQKPQIVEVEKVVEKVVEVPKVIEKKILVACFSTEKKCVIHGFAVDGRVPSKEEQKQLRDVASKINAFAESGTMSIVGHTDSDGSHAYNDKLSLQRATTVSRLLKEAGLSEALTVKEITGKGKREPMATNSTRVGKYLNRRVELLFDDIVIK